MTEAKLTEASKEWNEEGEGEQKKDLAEEDEGGRNPFTTPDTSLVDGKNPEASSEAIPTSSLIPSTVIISKLHC